jgi:hypothetical protein
MAYSGLIDAGTSILLDVATHGAAVIYTNKIMLDTNFVPTLDYPNYLKQFPLASADSKTYPEWTWKWGQRTLEKTRPDLLTDEVRAKSRLAVAKRQAVSTIMFSLSSIRYQTGTGVAFEESVYLVKKSQAQAFKASGYNEDKALEYPYVSQYADILGISMKQSADDILFAAQLDEETLLRTESLRITYFRKIADATDPDDIPAISQEFITETYSNALG